MYHKWHVVNLSKKEGVIDMKKKNVIMITAIILTLGIGGTCIACGDSRQKEQKQENTTEVKDVEKIADNKKENEKVQDDILSDSKVDAVEASTQNENVVSEKETDSDADVHTGNTSVTNTSSGNRTGNNSSASSSNNAGNNTGNSSTTPSGNSANNSINNSNSIQVQPTHTHTWVHVDATGHYETVTIQAAYDEEIPVYENVEHCVCNVCYEDLTGLTQEKVSAHSMAHALNYEGSGWHSEWKYEQTGTEIVHYDVITEQCWVQDSPAYDVCSGCGVTKKK